MAKLTLKVEALAVESFETLDGARGAGTVHAHETLESECKCGGGGGGWSVESCTYCGCDTPGYTCEDRCFPPATDKQIAGVLIGD